MAEDGCAWQRDPGDAGTQRRPPQAGIAGEVVEPGGAKARENFEARTRKLVTPMARGSPVTWISWTCLSAGQWPGPGHNDKGKQGNRRCPLPKHR